MMEEYAAELCGARYVRDDGKDAYRWGQTKGKLGFHGGKIELQRPRVRDRAGGEIALPNSHAAMAEDWLGKWALILMLINVSTRKFGRAARLPEGAVPAQNGAGVSKSAASRRFVALSAERMAEWMSSDISKLDLLVIQIDGIYIAEDPEPASAARAPASPHSSAATRRADPATDRSAAAAAAPAHSEILLLASESPCARLCATGETRGKSL